MAFFLRVLCIGALFMTLSTRVYSQTADSVEVFIIEAYVPAEEPNVFMLSFSTSEPCKSRLIIAGKYELAVADTFTENHRLKADVSRMQLPAGVVDFYLAVTNQAGVTTQSEHGEFELLRDSIVQEPKSDLSGCIAGGVVYLFPSVGIVGTNGTTRFMLAKELPILSFFSGGYNYPVGYIAAEYQHRAGTRPANLLYLGYKQIFETPVIEYISAGVNGFTSFKGTNGISPEVSVGLFHVLEVFTVYGRYRANFEMNAAAVTSHELSVGLFSSFFSLHR